MTVDELAEELFGDDEQDAPSGADLVVPHPATIFFSKKFRELAARSVRLDDGAHHRLTPVTVYQLLREQSPELPVSQRQVYRYYNGTATPRIDVVFELARIFDVSPRQFLPTKKSADDPIE